MGKQADCQFGLLMAHLDLLDVEWGPARHGDEFARGYRAAILDLKYDAPIVMGRDDG